MSKEHDLYLDIWHNAEMNDQKRFSDCRSIRIQDEDEAKITLQQYEIINGILVLTINAKDYHGMQGEARNGVE